MMNMKHKVLGNIIQSLLKFPEHGGMDHTGHGSPGEADITVLKIGKPKSGMSSTGDDLDGDGLTDESDIGSDMDDDMAAHAKKVSMEKAIHAKHKRF